MRTGASYSNRCPRCSAPPRCPCRNAEGEALPGIHFERNRARRKAIAAAMYLYAPLRYAREARLM